MRVLALDLGTKTGWAIADDDLLVSGTWTLVTDAKRKENIHFGKVDSRFATLQNNILGAGPFGAIFYEDVQFCKTQLQAQLWGGLRAVVSLQEVGKTVIRGIPVGTLKKFATGKGNATKSQMAQALYTVGVGHFEGAPEKMIKAGKFLVERSNQRPVDDNEVDAIHLLRYGLKQLNQPCPPHKR